MKTTDIEALKAHALNLWHTDRTHAVELGQALLNLRKAMPHGAFKKWWQQNKLTQARVSYCLRLALGKVAAAKARQPSPQQIAISQIKHHVDSCLKFCANSKHSQTVDEIEKSLASLFLGFIDSIGQVRGWRKVDAEDRELKRSLKVFKNSLGALMNDSFDVYTFEDLERLQPDCAPASQYMPKKPAQANVTA